MEDNKLKQPRRDFLGSIAAGAAAMGMATIVTPLTAAAEKINAHGTAYPDDADAWFNKVTGKHKIVFDVTRPNGVLPFAWPRVFLMTNAATGTPEKDNSVVVVLRHEGIGYAFNDSMWSKYNFGKVFNANVPMTKDPATKNVFWQPAPGTFTIPGVGPVDIGIDQLMASGVMFCVCGVAMTVYSAAVAGPNGDAAAIRKDWVANLLPGIQVVPSGVWAVGRAQEKGCAYCFAGDPE
jgi:intracellular sulfur oxidation DsrE/DsrF family protein